LNTYCFFCCSCGSARQNFDDNLPLSPVSRFKINLNLNSILDFLEAADNFKKSVRMTGFYQLDIFSLSKKLVSEK
jgi:hypothetical protein